MAEKPTYEELERRVQELKTEYSQLEKKLHEASSFSEEIMTYMTEGLVLTNVRETVIFINQRLSEMLGYQPEQIIGKCWLDMVSPEQQAIAQEVIARRAQGHTDRYEILLCHKDGHKVPVLIGAGPRFDKQSGEFIGTMGVVTDITERKRAEEVLQRNEKDLRESQRIAHVGSWRLDVATNQVVWTEELYNMFGFDPSLPPPPYTEHMKLFTPESWERLSTALARTTETGIPYTLELETLRKDGNNGWMWVRGETIRDAAGKTIGLWGAAQDITDRKLIEEALKESKTFLENMTDIAYMADDKGNILWINPAAERVAGLPPEDIIGKPFLPLFIEADHASLIDLYRRTLAGESLENTLTFKSGVTCHFNSLPKRNKYGDIIGIFGVARDISERQAAEHSLQTSEARLKRAQTMAKVGNWEYEIATGKVWGSEEVFRIYGIERTSEFLPLDKVESYIIDAKRVNQALVDLVAYNKAYDIEFQINSKNRKESIHVHSMAEMVFDGDGKPEKVVGVIQDITESKKAEKILKKNHEMLKRTEAMASIGSWEWDVQHDRAYWSEELFRIFGRDPAEGAPSFAEQSKFYANGDMQRLKDGVANCLKQGTSYEIELRALRPDGEIRHCVSRGQPQYDENGDVFRLTGSFQDITDRRHSENRFKSAERRNQALLDHSPVCHKIVDLDFNLQYMSANGFKMLKLDNNTDVYGKPYPFYFFPETFKKDMIKKLKKVKETGEMNTLEALANDIKGNEVWLDSSLIPVFDEKEKIVFITVVSADATQRKLEEEEKKVLEKQLQQAQKMESVGRLAGGVAHDFNNMLGVILGHTELALLKADENHDLYDDLEEIQTAAQRSADITKQLLAFARKEIISPKQIDLNDKVESMLNMLRRLIGEDIDLVWQPGTHLWPVKMDPVQIDQTLANLCINARDAIDGVGKLTIETGRKSFDEEYCKEHSGFIPGDFVLLAVSDNGCGMDKDTLDKMFEPFFTTKDVGKGTGLGLATIYGIVKQNNGFINVYSEPGKGSTFNIYLPQLVAEEDSEKAVSEKKAAAGGTETILLVEDEPSILRMTRMMLERNGYSVLSAATPSEAVEKATNHSGSIDLLMSDVVMPEMNGRDLAEKIISLYPEIRLLFMSGYTADVIAHQGILDDGVVFIQKPFSMADMTEKVRELLDMASDKS